MASVRYFFKKLFEKGPAGLIFFIVCWYGIVCLAHYLSQRPLWNDEMCVFYSIEQFSLKEIFTRPLLSLQVFPRVYLLIIQQFSKIFDFHLLALRWFPFLCMMGAFLVWLKIASYEFKNKAQYLTFALSWCASAVLIYYAAELKQYSMDVLVGSLFLLFLYRQEKLQAHKNRWFYFLCLAAMPFLLAFSYVTMFFCLFPLYNLTLSVKEDRKNIPAVIVYALSLSAAFLSSWYFDVRLAQTTVVVQHWQDYFVSVRSWSEFLKTLGEGTMNLYSRWFVERPKILKQIGIFFIVFGILYKFFGFFRYIKESRYRLCRVDTVALVIFAELFILGILKKYPFTVPRTSLFFCPIALYLTVKGIAYLKGKNKYVYGLVHLAYVCYLVFLSVALGFLAFEGQMTFRPVLW